MTITKQELKADIQAMLKMQRQVDDLASATRKDFEAFITDKSIPVGERWLFWVQAPDNLKDHHGWVVNGPMIDQCLDALHMDRYQIYKWADLLDTVVDPETQAVYREGLDNYRWSENFTIQEAEQLLEEVLVRNQGSFKWDW